MTDLITGVFIICIRTVLSEDCLLCCWYSTISCRDANKADGQYCLSAGIPRSPLIPVPLIRLKMIVSILFIPNDVPLQQGWIYWQALFLQTMHNVFTAASWIEVLLCCACCFGIEGFHKKQELHIFYPRPFTNSSICIWFRSRAN